MGRWRALGLPLLPYGEWGAELEQGLDTRADVRTTPGDEPRLDDLLRLVNSRAHTRMVVLIRGDAVPSSTWCEALTELALRQPAVLAFGRAWRPDPQDGRPRLDGAFCPSWILLPRGPWQPPPHLAEDLAADPMAALPWLLELAQQQGWTVLEATDAAPLDEPCRARQQNRASSLSLPAAGVRVERLTSTPGAGVRLSLLLPPGVEAESWRGALLPAERLPWEVIEAPPTHWHLARGELIWPLPAAAEPPPLALLPALLRATRNPWIDGISLPEAPALLRRAPLERLGPSGFDPAESRARGLRLISLPLSPRSLSPGHTRSNHDSAGMDEAECSAEADALWQASQRQLARAEALLLAQQRRIARLEAQLRALAAPDSSAPGSTPDDPADG
jgi:hypothetical protein